VRWVRVMLSLIVLLPVGSLVLALRSGIARADGEARDERKVPAWIEPFSALRPGPFELRDARAPLDQRIALAEALGEHGPARPAIATLEAALGADPPPPSRLREAIARALARRIGAAGAPGSSKTGSKAALAREPSAKVLEAAKRRPPPQVGRGPGQAWLSRPRPGGALVHAFLAETDPLALRAMVRKLAELQLLAPEPTDPKAAPPSIAQALCDRKAAPHALLMLAAEAERPPADTTRRALRAALAGVPCANEALSAPADDPDAAALRVLGALALAAIDDIEAVPALRHALASPFARVRLAAATALAVLATKAACSALASHAHVENSALVRSALTCTVQDRD
jgi:HEAT repeat protein